MGRVHTAIVIAAAAILGCLPALGQEAEDGQGPAEILGVDTYWMDEGGDHPVGHVPAVFYDGEGRLLAAGGSGSLVRFEGDHTVTVVPGGADILSAGVDGEGRIAVLRADGRVELRSSVNGAVIAATDPIPGAICMAVARGASLVIVGAGEEAIVLSLPELRECSRHAAGAPVLAVDGAADGRIAYGDARGLLHIVSADGTEIACQADSSAVYGVAFSPDGATLAAGGFDRTVRLVAPATGAIQAQLPPHSYWVTAVGWSPDGKIIAAGDESCHVTVFDLQVNAVIGTFAHHDECWLTEVSFSPEGDALVFGCRPNGYTAGALGGAEVSQVYYAAAGGAGAGEAGEEVELAMLDSDALVVAGTTVVTGEYALPAGQAPAGPAIGLVTLGLDGDSSSRDAIVNLVHGYVGGDGEITVADDGTITRNGEEIGRYDEDAHTVTLAAGAPPPTAAPVIDGAGAAPSGGSAEADARENRYPVRCWRLRR